MCDVFRAILLVILLLSAEKSPDCTHLTSHHPPILLLPPKALQERIPMLVTSLDKVCKTDARAARIISFHDMLCVINSAIKHVINSRFLPGTGCKLEIYNFVLAQFWNSEYPSGQINLSRIKALGCSPISSRALMESARTSFEISNQKLPRVGFETTIRKLPRKKKSIKRKSKITTRNYFPVNTGNSYKLSSIIGACWLSALMMTHDIRNKAGRKPRNMLDS